MKLYKFRSLATIDDFRRAKSILETGHFWCSKFSELNDPMEGVFITSRFTDIENICKEKYQYKICSFSGQNAFKNPAMWGYYTNGFKGIAIEIDIDISKVKKISYIDTICSLIDSQTNDEVQQILTSKLKPWKYEAEYRFLERSEKNEHKIGKIIAVHFGEPYQNTDNRDAIYERSDKLRLHKCFRNKLIIIANEQRISTKFISISNDGKIKTSVG